MILTQTGCILSLPILKITNGMQLYFMKVYKLEVVCINIWWFSACKICSVLTFYIHAKLILWNQIVHWSI